MKKALIGSASFLALLLVLTGCAKTSSSVNPQAQQENGNQPGRMRQPDFGQPDRQPDIRGIVKSIVGNEVAVLKIDMPGRNASSTPGGMERNNANANGEVAPSVSLTGRAGTRGAGAGSGAGMMMGTGGPGGPDGPGGPGEQTGETRAQMLAKLKELSTGEEKIIIPVGIRMLKMDTSNNKKTMVEATLADITADKNITVWTVAISPETTASTTENIVTRKIAEFVLIN